eukprot:8260171-Karenia_brevis.AAC.1
MYKPCEQSAQCVFADDGQLTLSRRHAKEAFFEQFTELLGGEHVSFDVLVRRDRDLNCTDSKRDLDVSYDPAAAPCLLQLARAYAHSKPYKGLSEDVIGGELLRACPLEMARLYHPLVYKAACSLSAPLQWKGGALVELYKGRGQMTDRTSYRDVTIGSSPGKGMTSHLRARALPFLRKLAPTTQFGG